ncbi:MAG: Xaa-Pro peptidase family protein [Actinomycetota bacterium]
MSRFEARQERCLAALAEKGVDAMLVTDLANVRYLTGYVGSNGVAVLAPDRRLLFTDFRYAVSARAQTRGVEVVQAGRDLLDRVAAALADAAPAGRVGVEADDVTLARHARLVEKLPGVEIVPLSGVVEDLRLRKDEEEIALMRRAARIADAAYEWIAGQRIVGRSEREVAWELEGAMMRAGSDGPSFPIIVAAAERGAMPHATPGADPIPANTLVVVDLGATVEGYCSDCTRTFATGPLPDALAEAYATCLDAQRAALDAARPGIAAADLDAVARDRIAAAGHGERFGHGLGHGVGLEIHERPWVRREGTDTLAPGMTFTVEPGIYIEGLGGVRIEDLCVATDGGREVLTGFPTDLVTLS